MKALLKSNFNHDAIKKKIEQSLNLLIEVIRALGEVFLFYWKHAHQFHPQQYVSLFLRGKVVVFRLYEGERVLEEKEYKLHDMRLEGLRDKLLEHEGVPLYLLIFNSDCDFRTVDLGQVRWFDRWTILKQILIGHFEEKDWVIHFRNPSRNDKKRHWFIGLKPSSSCRQFVQWLGVQKSPIIAVQHAVVPLAQRIFQAARKQIAQELSDWVCIVYRTTHDEWHIIVCHDEAIVSYRHGYLNEDTFLETDLLQEVTTTLRYIERLGYVSGNPVTLVQCGFDKKFDIPMDCIVLHQNFENEIMVLPRYRLIDWVRNLFKSASALKASFMPTALIAHVVSFRLTKSLIAVLLPIIYFCLIGMAYLPIKSLKNDAELHALKVANHQQYGHYQNFDKKLLSAKLFNYYAQKSKFDVMGLLRTLAKSVSPEGVATDIRWHIEPNVKTKKDDKILTVTLEVDEQGLLYGKKRRGKLKQKPKTIEQYQKKVEESLKTLWSPAYIHWQATTPYKQTLKISFNS